MSQAITAARPYAQAAFDEAQKQNDLNGWSDVLAAGAAVVASPDMNTVIGDPRVQRRQLEDVMQAACETKPGSTQSNFLRLLVENQRLVLLPEIAEAYEAMRAEALKSLDVTVSSAFDLNAAQQQKIADALKKRYNRAITLSCKTDKNLVGGVVIRAGDQVIDGSVETRLQELANALA
jgi:F-type H+-transporting ATPase subunit delta